MEKTEATSTLLRRWLVERGVGFVFLPVEIPCATIGCEHDAISASLSNFTKRGLLTREPVTHDGAATYRYTVGETMVNTPFKPIKRPVFANRKYNGASPHVVETAPKLEPIEVICDRILDDLALLAKRANAPLRGYTNAQLIAELNDRCNAAVAIAPPVSNASVQQERTDG